MRDLNPRKLIGAVAFGLLLLVVLGIRYIAAISQDDWDPFWSLAYALGLGIALFTAFYDRKTFPKRHGISIRSAVFCISF